MDVGQTTWTVFASIGMFAAFFLAILPIVPGALLMWAVALIYAIFTGFALLTPLAFGIITLLMIASFTSDYWLPFLGVRSEGGSLYSAMGTIVGGLIGTFVIPIPVLGTLIGSIAGAVIVEVVRLRTTRVAGATATFAVRMFIIGMATEIIFCLVILIIFFLSILTMS